MESNLDLAPCLIFSCKDDGTIININNVLCHYLGYSKEELIGSKIEKIFTISTRIFQQTHFFPLLKMHGHAEEIFISLQAKDNEHLPVLINAERKEINNEAVTFYAGIVVRNRKKFEDELIAARQAAEAALHENSALLQTKEELQNNMEQLDEQLHIVKKQNDELKQFNRVATHDLQEPLRKLSIFSNLLLEAKDPIHTENILKKMVSVSDQMRTVVSGLQQYVWLTETKIKLSEVDLNKLLLVVNQQLVNEFPHIEFVVEAKQLPVIMADWNQMQTLLYQLFSNAVRFRKEETKATVEISASNIMLNSFRYVKDKYKYAEFLKVEVKDSGIGFDTPYKDQVFELFRRLHSISGQGIGLSLCKKIIENHHGEITIDSVKEKGTTVTMHLPLIENA